MTNTHALIIDDNSDNLMVLSRLLKLEGIECTFITDPRMLTDLIETQGLQPDIIFLDLEFPQTNGYKILEYFRSKFNLAEIPVVAYSVHMAELETVRNAGFHSFIAKPVNLDLFPQQLNSILSGNQVWAI